MDQAPQDLYQSKYQRIYVPSSCVNRISTLYIDTNLLISNISNNINTLHRYKPSDFKYIKQYQHFT